MLEQLQRKLRNLVHVLWACRGIVAFGFLTSAAGNVLSAEKHPIPIGIALVAPVILLMAFEVMSRIPFPEREAGWLRWAGTFVRLLAMVSIVAIMMVTSYRHQSHAFLTYGKDQLQADWLPWAIDAFMIVGSLSVIEVQIFIRKYEMQIAGLTDAKNAREKAPEAPREKVLTKKERIAILLREQPGATIEELAKLAQASPGYVSAIKAELKQPALTLNGNGNGVH
jgi:hypothetical protein